MKIAKLKTLLIDYFIILQLRIVRILDNHAFSFLFVHSILPMKIQNHLKSKKNWHQMGTLMVDLDLLTPKAILYSLNTPKMLRDNCKIFRIIIFFFVKSFKWQFYSEPLSTRYKNISWKRRRLAICIEVFCKNFKSSTSSIFFYIPSSKNFMKSKNASNHLLPPLLIYSTKISWKHMKWIKTSSSLLVYFPFFLFYKIREKMDSSYFFIVLQKLRESIEIIRSIFTFRFFCVL